MRHMVLGGFPCTSLEVSSVMDHIRCQNQTAIQRCLLTNMQHVYLGVASMVPCQVA
jgi:hypothetical protein